MTNNNIITKESKATGAILAAAYGDALGWPNERTNRVISDVSKSLREWERKSGGQYYPYVEIINTGSYSDDTQLILALCRSYEYGKQWWDFWTKVELPFWTVYERGGGGATKRAAKCWLMRNPPWSKKRKEKELKTYFEAGGNGVAMRTLPHILFHPDSSYEKIAQKIFQDGIATHGHPEALIGALAYGYSLWRSFNREGNLVYGQLIDELLENGNKWGQLSTDYFKEVECFDEWHLSATDIYKNYDSIWQDTFEKMKGYLTLSKEELTNSSMADDDHLLKKINCFDKNINGSGTVAATSSVYLASRYITNPMNGVVKAAFSLGADTDTIASMTGGLLGLLCGHNWIISKKDVIQDGDYLLSMPQKILSNNKKTEKNIQWIKSSDISTWTHSILKLSANEKIDTLDGRKALVDILPDIRGKNDRFKVMRRRLNCEDGQSLYCSKITQAKNIAINKCMIKIFVKSLKESSKFYTRCFDMNIKKKNGRIVVFQEGIVLSSQEKIANGEENDSKMALCLQVANIEKVFSLIQQHKIKTFNLDKNGSGKINFFNCSDIDGNRIEVSSSEL